MTGLHVSRDTAPVGFRLGLHVWLLLVVARRIRDKLARAWGSGSSRIGSRGLGHLEGEGRPDR